MKKNTIKAFTLVEMLIVIVIIGILIASLMPRMQSAQGRARDVARKNDLSQIQTAIITSQQDRGVWPEMSGAKNGMSISGDTIEDKLKSAGMTSVPKDPNGSNVVSGLGSGSADAGSYQYMVTKRNGVEDAGFALMAKTEVEGGSNRVVCSGDAQDGKIQNGYIGKGADLKDIQLCTQVTKQDECKNESGTCTYKETSELRYLLVY